MIQASANAVKLKSKKLCIFLYVQVGPEDQHGNSCKIPQKTMR